MYLLVIDESGLGLAKRLGLDVIKVFMEPDMRSPRPL